MFNRSVPLVFKIVLITAGMVCLSGGPDWIAAPLTPISGLSPYDDGGDPNDPSSVTACNGGPQIGVVYRNSETEPHLAVNPTNSMNMIAGWHQDRWSTGAAQGVSGAYTTDGGTSWTPFDIPFTRCSGGMPGSSGDYQRASDPWISFGADGAAYYMALVTDDSTLRNGMSVSKTIDGGATWSTPVLIRAHAARSANARSLFHDKNTLTADPMDPDLVYATWTLFRNGNTTLLFSRSTDGGESWSAARPVNNFEMSGEKPLGTVFRQGAQVVVLPDGTLVNGFYRFLFDPRRGAISEQLDQAVFRSFDQGKHWEHHDIKIADLVPTGALDLEPFLTTGMFLPIRDAGQLPAMAVDPQSGAVYHVWQDGRFSSLGASSVVISKSDDGGLTWSTPIPVHDVSDPFHQGFLPAVTVNSSGVVGVLFYDFRNDEFGDAPLSTDVHLTTLDSDLNILAERRLTDTSFDMRQMLITGFSGFFPGDYVGLDTAGEDFVAAFTVSNDLGLPVEFPQDNSGLRVDIHNRQDIVFVRVSATSD